MASARRQIGQELLERGLVTPDALNAALFEHRVTHERLGKVLVRRGFLTLETLVSVLRDIGAEGMLEDEVFGSEIPGAVLLATQSMVVARTDDAFLIGTRGPSGEVQRRLAPYAGSRAIRLVPVDRARLTRYLQQLAASEQGGTLEGLLAKAVAEKVSDIHILPKNSSYTVFFRHLGVRHIEAEGPISEYAQLVARIKDRARLDIAERRVPQDGAFSMSFAGKSVDFRVASVPTTDGEYLVIRVLDPDNAQQRLEELGLTRLTEWRAGVSRPDGLCLICGPTGSGKTTTLNATVREMDRFGSSIFSAEDPVEYSIAFTGQVNVNPGVGLDFARALKAFMRADPDIILLGEIRDQETAKAAVKMAETGHLVLATLHTESVHGATQRLQDIGVPRHELAYLLRSVLVQRLMRITCGHCGGSGCARCRNGYSARTVVSECAYFTDHAQVQRMLGGERWWPSMLEDGYEKVRAGITNRQEFIRVFGIEAERMLAAQEPHNAAI